MLENGSDLHVNKRQKVQHYHARSTEERRRIRRIRRRMANHDFYYVWCVQKLRYYDDVIHSFDWKSAIKHDGGV